VLESLQVIHQVDTNTQKTRYTKEIDNSHPRAKHAPSGTYSTWTAFTGNYPLKHLRIKASDASPSGILNHLLYPHHKYN
jgi:hypothetical protein